MVEIEIKPDQIYLEVLGSHKFWAFKSKILIPITCIRSIGFRTGKYDIPWIRSPGTAWPGKIIAGTYYAKDRKEFWDTNCRGNEIQFDLRDHEFTRVVVEVEDAAKTVSEISGALGIRI
jgi:hypothetical protein